MYQAATLEFSLEDPLPRYDYRCSNCDLVFEVKQSFSSDPVSTCPDCKSKSQRVIHSVPVVFKGSGFYVNDYGKGGGSSGTSSTSKDSQPSKSENSNEPKVSKDSKASSTEDSKADTKT